MVLGHRTRSAGGDDALKKAITSFKLKAKRSKSSLHGQLAAVPYAVF